MLGSSLIVGMIVVERCERLRVCLLNQELDHVVGIAVQDLPRPVTLPL